jgi:peptidoglycan/xylan/chitin deacetylase (PgdA/CDA1 family)
MFAPKVTRPLAGILFALFATSATAQDIAITLDDLPYVMPSRTTPQEGLAIVQSVNAALAEHGIIATGFAVGQQLNRRSQRALQAFADAGHTIGNHSWSHPDYGTLTARQFRKETARTDRALSAWITGPRYYRFPFLREGETEQAKRAATEILSNLGYDNVPVTIDNDEWKFNSDYMDALDSGDTQGADEIAAAYIAHMQERTDHFHELAKSALGRDVKHILLLHMNKINADHLDSLLDWYASEGWTFVPVQTALTDPLYAAPDLYVGPRGLSQIERIMGRKSE